MSEHGAHGTSTYQPIRAPRGGTLSCQGWPQEAALRMLMNSLDPEVVENPARLLISGSAAKLARNWESFQTLAASLRALGNEETLLVRDHDPAAVIRTNADTPRALIADATWSYVGTQGILPTTYEIFSAAAKKHFRGTLAGRLVVSGGMGGSGGAQPLAATANGAAFLGIDADPERIKRRVKAGYCDMLVNNLDEALRILKNAVRKRETASVGLIGNCGDVIPALARRGVVPDILTDQTSTDIADGGYVPQGLTVEQAADLRHSDAPTYRQRALNSLAATVQGMLELQKLGSTVFTYGNKQQTLVQANGVPDAHRIADGVAEYLRPFYRDRAPLLWVALSGDAADIAHTDQLALKIFRQDDAPLKEIRLAQRVPRFQGLPVRLCWPSYQDRPKLASALNSLVASGEVKAPLVIACDHFAAASLASSAGQMEKAPNSYGSIADWQQLDSLLQIACGSSWVSIQFDQAGSRYRAGWGAVADGTPRAAQGIERILAQDKALWDT